MRVYKAFNTRQLNPSHFLYNLAPEDGGLKKEISDWICPIDKEDALYRGAKEVLNRSWRAARDVFPILDNLALMEDDLPPSLFSLKQTLSTTGRRSTARTLSR